MNKKINEFTTIDRGDSLLILVWDPSTNSTKTILASDLPAASTLASGMVLLATSGDVTTGTNNEKAVTPESIAFMQYNKANTSSSYTLNTLSGEITDAGFSLGGDAVIRLAISNSLIAAGDMVAVTIQTASPTSDRLNLTNVFTDNGHIYVCLHNANTEVTYTNTLKIKFKKL